MGATTDWGGGTALARVLARLPEARRTRDGWQARCPAHDDRHPSLAIGEGEGRVLLKCFAGCETAAIARALGLRLTDLFDGTAPRPKAAPRPTAAPDPAGAKVAAVYDYTDAAGTLLFQVVRLDPKGFRQRQPDGQGGWRWHLRGVVPVLFRLPRVREAAARGELIFVAEGEKDVLALEALGLTATCNPMGAGKWRPEYTATLAGTRVIVVPDNDGPGLAHAARIAQALAGRAAETRVLELPGLPPHGDVSDWLAQGGSRDALEALVAAAGAPAEFPLTDLGNAERLVAAHGADLRYHARKDGWLCWAGTHWAEDATGEVHRRAGNVIRELGARAERLPDGPARESLVKFAHRSEAEPRLAAMVKLARHRPGIPVLPDALDRPPLLLNCANGIVDLRDGTLRPHDPEALLTRLAPVAYDPGAACPRWARFLDEIFPGDLALQGYLQRMAGYLITADTREQCVFFLVGKGANGKSVLLETLRSLLGDYGRDTPVDTFLDTREASTVDIAALDGARLVTASEGDSTQRFKESLVKRLSGGDAVTCRHLYQAPFTYLPTYKLLVATNEMPRFAGQSYAMRRRVQIIPFRQTFYAPEDERAPRRDPQLAKALRAEWPGILAWAVTGARLWQAVGLCPPPTVREETDALFDEYDPLADFLDDACVCHPEARAEVSALWRGYLAWCDRQQRAPAFRSPQGFSRNLHQRAGIESTRTHAGRCLQGITLRDDDAPGEW